jgi:hypothetical protein
MTKTMKKLFPLLLFCLSLRAQTSVQFLPYAANDFWNNSASLTTPATTAYTAAHRFRIEFRVHDLSWSTDGGFHYRLTWNNDSGGAMVDNICGGPSPSAIWARPKWPNPAVCLDVGSRTDVVYRFQVDIDAGWTSFDAFDVGTGLRVVSSSPTTFTVGDVPVQDLSTMHIGFPGKAAYFKIFSTTVPVTTVPHEWDSADLADYRFETGLIDLTGNTSLNLNGKTASYSASPGHAPVCNAGTAQVFRAGYAEQLDGSLSSSSNSAALPGFRWSQVSGPASVAFDSLTIARPTIRGLIAGTYNFQLTVTEGSLSSTCTVIHSAVTSDVTGTVALPNAQVSFLLGPLMRQGASQWTWVDDRHKAMADKIISQLDTNYPATWDVAQAGTVAVTTGSQTVVGTGTTFTTTFCNGPANPTVSKGLYFVVWYAVSGDASHYGRYPVGVTSCTDDTHMTIERSWGWPNGERVSPYLAAGSAYNYAACDLGLWATQGTPANYYDVVAGLYSLYYRSGDNTYLTAARKLADRWWRSPVWDEGRYFYGWIYGYNASMPRRNAAVLGLVLRTLDGRPEMWAGLERKWEWDRAWLDTYQSGNHDWDDIRENAYVTSELSYCIALEPNAAQRTLCRGSLVKAFTQALAYRAAQGPQDGGLEGYYYSAGSWSSGADNGVHGAQVTNGSTTVTGTGTNWYAQFCPNGTCATKTIWFSPNPATVMPLSTAGDSAYYTATYVSNTQLTLDRAYTGVTNSNAGWVLGDASGLIGWGSQPFMAGMAAVGFDYAGRALTLYGDSTNAAVAFGYAKGLANWIKNYGYRASTKGLYYTGGLVGCQTAGGSSEASMCTSDYNAMQSRSLSPEAIRGMGVVYQQTGDAELKAIIDTMYSATYSKPGTGPDADGTYFTDIDDGGWWMPAAWRDNGTHKYFGMSFGFGSVNSWPAQRIWGISSITLF